MEQAETYTWTQIIHITQQRELFLAIRKLGVLRKKSYPVYGKRGQCMASELIIGSGLIGEIRSSASPLLLIPATALSRVVAAVQPAPEMESFNRPLSLISSFHYCKVRSLRNREKKLKIV